MKPFEHKIPSVFSIGTPFQALCAIAAIKQLEIDDYLVLINRSLNGERYEQICSIFDTYNIHFKVINPFNYLTYYSARWRALRKRNTHYKRLFVGDFRDIILYYTGLRYIADGSEVIYLDDGNVTISLLQDIVSEPINEKHILFFNDLESKRNIVVYKNLMTIYGDIENPKYVVHTLDLSLVMQRKQNINILEGVYIVGTNINSYCKPLGMSHDIFIKKLEELIEKIKKLYPDKFITFVPHGRDKSEYANEICRKHGILFEPAKMTIELKLLNAQYPPKVVYGFTSSALYNIKKIFPQTKVVNIIYECNADNPCYQEYLAYSDYYLQNGIELIKESLKD